MMHLLRSLGLAVTLLALPASADPGGGFHPLEAARFTPNQGQWPKHVEWAARHDGAVLTLERDGFGIQVRDGERGHLIRFVFEGAAHAAESSGVEVLPGVSHYLQGTCVVTDVPGFAQVRRDGVWPGVSVAFGAREERLAYDLEVMRARDLEGVSVRIEGADAVHLDPDGALTVETACGEVRQLAPVVFLGAEAQPVECRYRLDGERFRFELPGLSGAQLDQPLLVDPSLVWSTYLGGTGLDVVRSVDIRPDGSLLVSGVSQSNSFPTTPGAFQEADLPGQDGFVSVLSADGSTLAFSTYVGGSDAENGTAAFARQDGGVIVVGDTKSPDHPVHPSGFDTTHNGDFDIVVFGLNAAGNALDMGTFVGGVSREVVGGFAVDADGTILVTGRNCEFVSTFPVTPGAYQTEIPWITGICDGVVFRLSADCTSLLASTLLGGSGDEWPQGVLALPGGDVLIAGFTLSADYPTTPGVLQESNLPTVNQGFASRLSADLTTAVASTFVPMAVSSACLDGSGRLVLGGNVNPGMEATFLPGPAAWSADPEGGGLAGIGILDGSLSAWHALSYVPGSPGRTIADMALDPWGILLTMQASVEVLPATPDALATVPASHATGYVARLDDGLTRLLYGSYLGGVQAGLNGGAFSVAATGSGDAIVAGGLDNMQTTPGTFDPAGNGSQSGFVTRLRTAPPWSVTAAGLGGEIGEPVLVGHGWPVVDELVGVTLTKARPLSTATWVLGVSQLAVPFKGGVLDPAPDLLIPALPVDADGRMTITFTWPRGIPSGFATWHQLWIADASGPAGFSSSNGLVVESE